MIKQLALTLILFIPVVLLSTDKPATTLQEIRQEFGVPSRPVPQSLQERESKEHEEKSPEPIQDEAEQEASLWVHDVLLKVKKAAASDNKEYQNIIIKGYIVGNIKGFLMCRSSDNPLSCERSSLLYVRKLLQIYISMTNFGVTEIHEMDVREILSKAMKCRRPMLQAVAEELAHFPDTHYLRTVEPNGTTFDSLMQQLVSGGANLDVLLAIRADPRSLVHQMGMGILYRVAQDQAVLLRMKRFIGSLRLLDKQLNKHLPPVVLSHIVKDYAQYNLPVELLQRILALRSGTAAAQHSTDENLLGEHMTSIMRLQPKG